MRRGRVSERLVISHTPLSLRATSPSLGEELCISNLIYRTHVKKTTWTRRTIKKTISTKQLGPSSIAHAGGVDLFSLFLLEVAYAVDNLERGVGRIRVPDAHGVVLIGKRGTNAGISIEDVGALSRDAPFAVVRCPTERGIQTEHRVNVIDALYGPRLEEGVENKLEVVARGEFKHSCPAHDG